MNGISRLGSLKCQTDSQVKSLETTVMICKAVEQQDTEKRLFHVVLQDTVIFPTGGGQPCDLGSINGMPVVEAFRKDGTCVHVVEGEVREGQRVIVEVDWERRFDHMQQHSCQHLLSAVMLRDLNVDTFGWALNPFDKPSFFELVGVANDDAILQSVERTVNAIIREGIDVTVRTVEQTEASGIVADEFGDARFVSIGQIDDNACCGTHVSNTKDIQVVKIVGTEKVRKTNLRVMFVAGNRLVNAFHASLLRDRQLNVLLCCGPELYVQRVEQMRASIKQLTKEAKKSKK